jgi:hypothetical protein
MGVKNKKYENVQMNFAIDPTNRIFLRTEFFLVAKIAVKNYFNLGSICFASSDNLKINFEI